MSIFDDLSKWSASMALQNFENHQKWLPKIEEKIKNEQKPCSIPTGLILNGVFFIDFFSLLALVYTAATV